MWYDGIVNTFNNMWKPKRLDDGTWFYPLYTDAFKAIDCLKAYQEVPEVSAVINRKATSYSNGVFKVVNPINGKDKPNDKINRLLLKPNWFQTQKEFMENTCLFHEIFGNEILNLFFPVGFQPTIDNVSALYTLPPNLVKAEYLDKLPFYMFNNVKGPNIEYSIEVGANKRDKLDPNSIIHLNDNRVTMKTATDKDMLWGRSKLEALAVAINNIRLAYESRGVILKNRGALGVLSNDAKDGIGAAAPIDPKEIENIERKYQQNYGGLAGQYQIIVSSAPLKWQQMGVNPDKLGLFQEIKESFQKVKDAYEAPDELFASDNGNTYENKNQAWKRWYESTIIPDANERLIALNSKMMQDSNYAVIADYSHLPIFQDDIKHRSEALSQYVNALSALLQVNQISPEEYRAELKKKFEIGTGAKIVVPAASADDVASATQAKQAELRGTVGGIQGVLAIQASVAAGTTTPDAGIAALELIFGFSHEDAVRLLGNPEQATPPPTPEPVPVV